MPADSETIKTEVVCPIDTNPILRLMKPVTQAEKEDYFEALKRRIR